MTSNSPSNFSERFNRVAQNQQNTESTGEFSLRNIGQQAARSAETYLGVPGNMKKAFTQTRDYLKSFMPEESEDLSELEEKAIGKPQKGSYEELIFNPPGSEELRETATKNLSKKLTGNSEYLEPRGEKEKFAGELNQDLTNFFLPGSSKMKFAVKLGAPIAANLAKQGLKFLGSDEETADKAKMGIMLASSIAGQSDPGKFSSERISQGKQMVPQSATANVSPLMNDLNTLETQLSKGLGVPSKAKTLEGIKDLKAQTQNGRMPLHNLMEARDHVNEWISEAGGWDVPAPVRDKSIRNLNKFKSHIISSINDNLEKRFPQAAELYKTGYEAAAVNHQSQAISNFIERNFGKKASSAGAKILFPALAGGAAVLPKTVVIAALTYPAYNFGQVMYRISKSPTLAKHYQDVITMSSIGNATAMQRSLAKLDKELEKQERKDRGGKKQTLEDFKSKFKKTGS